MDVYQAEKLAIQIQLGAIERRLEEQEDRGKFLQRALIGTAIGFVANVVGLLLVYLLVGGPR